MALHSANRPVARAALERRDDFIDLAEIRAAPQRRRDHAAGRRRPGVVAREQHERSLGALLRLGRIGERRAGEPGGGQTKQVASFHGAPPILVAIPRFRGDRLFETRAFGALLRVKAECIM
jgi:hypothetical protein